MSHSVQRRWYPIAFAIAALVLLPLSVLLLSWHEVDGEIWAHLWDTQMPRLLGNTLLLVSGVSFGVVLLGVSLAWLTSLCEFPGRRWLDWALMLPFAIPAYVLAFVFVGLLDFAGPLQTLAREWFGSGIRFPRVRSSGGVILVLVLVFYPYVYLLARGAFLAQGKGLMEAARVLGLSPLQAFWRVALPMARPAIGAGVALALMETLADYGTVAYFAVNTFTTGIYRAWFSLGDRVASAQLAAMLLGFVLLLVAVERITRGRARYNNTSTRHRAPAGRLRGAAALLAMLSCLTPLALGFLLPAFLLLRMALGEGDAQFGERFLVLARNSFTLAGLTALVAVALAVLLAYSARLSKTLLAQGLNRLVGLGYAVPGTVIAVGVLIPVTRLDHALIAAAEAWFGVNPGLMLTGGIAALIYAYLVRFLAVALNAVGESLAKITASMDEAARSLGCGQGGALRRVHLPILRGSLLTAGLLVFVDVMKELPATLVMRPFNFDTLATQAHTLAADERLAEASTAALIIVAVGLLPMFWISRQILRVRRREG